MNTELPQDIFGVTSSRVLGHLQVFRDFTIGLAIDKQQGDSRLAAGEPEVSKVLLGRKLGLVAFDDNNDESLGGGFSLPGAVNVIGRAVDCKIFGAVTLDLTGVERGRRPMRNDSPCLLDIPSDTVVEGAQGMNTFCKYGCGDRGHKLLSFLA